jgi:uncharacterized repeat protein (TIGR02059 family)
LCADATCASPLGATFSSASGVANGTNGSAAVPAGRITADGTYYWQAQAKDDVNQASPWSAIRSFSVDTGAPSLQSASATGTTLTLTFDEALDEGEVPDASAFAVTRNGSTLTVTNVSIGGGVVTLTLSAAARNGDDVDVAYTKPGSGDTLRDPSGNEVASFGPTAVTNGTANVAPNVAAPVSPANGANLATASAPTPRAPSRSARRSRRRPGSRTAPTAARPSRPAASRPTAPTTGRRAARTTAARARPGRPPARSSSTRPRPRRPTTRPPGGGRPPSP